MCTTAYKRDVTQAKGFNVKRKRDVEKKYT